jgi:predicted transposase YbfD/YdcC
VLFFKNIVEFLVFSFFGSFSMFLSPTFMGSFSALSDPRRQGHNQQHFFIDILTIVLMATICGADNWVEMEEFACSKQDWLRTFLRLPNGIPSHDTLARVFSALDASEFERCFIDWIKTIYIPKRDIIAVDGKTSCASHNKHKGIKALHMVSAWSTENKLCLGQVKTDEKSNEIEAMPRLLRLLNLQGNIVTTDAMGCQKEIAATIKDKGGDYVLTLKENQPKLYNSVKNLFDLGDITTFEKMHYRKQIEKIRGFKNHGEHGRVETRKYTLITAKDTHAFGLRWPGLVSLGRLDVIRTVRNKDVTRSTRYFLTSLSYQQIDDFMRAARKHWDIEINLHWSLDVSFADDLNRTRTGNAAENLSIIKRIALNILKQDKSSTKGITAKRKRAGWDHQYLANLFTDM